MLKYVRNVNRNPINWSHIDDGEVVEEPNHSKRFFEASEIKGISSRAEISSHGVNETAFFRDRR